MEDDKNETNTNWKDDIKISDDYAHYPVEFITMSLSFESL